MIPGPIPTKTRHILYAVIFDIVVIMAALLFCVFGLT